MYTVICPPSLKIIYEKHPFTICNCGLLHTFLLGIYLEVELPQAIHMLNFSRKLQVAFQIGPINFHSHSKIQWLAQPHIQCIVITGIVNLSLVILLGINTTSLRF